MKKITTIFAVGLVLTSAYHSKKWLKKLVVAQALGVSVMAAAPAYAATQDLVQSYAVAIKTSANAQNIGQIAKLIDDNAVISISRQGKASTLDKNAYLQLLQKSWAGATNYRYDITVNDVVTGDDQVRATVSTVESWQKDGKKVQIHIISKITLVPVGDGVVLSKAISQIEMD